MNFVKRAFLSLTRRKGRALILFLVAFILGNLIAGAIAIQQATGNVEKNIKSQLGGRATIDVDNEKLQEAYSNGEEFNIEPLSEETIKQIGQSKNVKYYDYNLEMYGGAKEIKGYKPEATDSDLMISQSNDTSSEFRLKGLAYHKILDIEENKVKLVEGRVFTKEEVEKGEKVGLISKQVAEENGLSIGDTFIYQTNVFNYDNNFSETTEPLATRDVPIEIIGIFEPVKMEKKEGEESKKADPMAAFMNNQFYNTVFVPNGVTSAESQFETDTLKANDAENIYEPSFSPVFVLKSPEVVDDFKVESKSLIPSNYKLNASTDQYNSIAAPIKSMSKFSVYTLVAAVGAALLIVTLVILLFLRDRKHEFGVYLSLGERRKNVLGQIIIEVLVVSLVAISLSVFTGNYLAKGVSSSMIESQIQADKEKTEAGSGESVMMFSNSFSSANDLSTEDVTNEYEVSLSLSYIISFFVIGVSTILLATIVPMTYLIRLNPKKIMM